MFLTRKAQELLFLMNETDFLTIDMADCTNEYFYKTMSQLKNKGLVLSCCAVCLKVIENGSICEKKDNYHRIFILEQRKMQKKIKKCYRLSLTGKFFISCIKD